MSQQETNSVEQQYSRYVQGGLTDRYNNRLGWWERRIMKRRDDDYNIIVAVEEAGRPDIISNQVYGQDKYAWLVLQYNNIVDIATELIPGKKLVLPHQQRLLLDILNKSTGGNPV